MERRRKEKNKEQLAMLIYEALLSPGSSGLAGNGGSSWPCVFLRVRSYARGAMIGLVRLISSNRRVSDYACFSSISQSGLWTLPSSVFCNPLAFLEYGDA